MPGQLLSAPSVASGGSITARGICQNTSPGVHILPSIQNAAAHFLTGASRRDHISPVLRSLHWLSVKQRIDYKLASLVYKSLRGQAPSYLVNDCQLIADSRRLQFCSAHANVLTVPRTNTRLGDKSFSVAGPRIWNSLYPSHCGSMTLNLDTLNDFNRHFCLARPQRISDIQCAVHKSIYLLTHLLTMSHNHR